MSAKYNKHEEVPTSALADRLKELAGFVAKNDFSDFSMRVPAELDRDADLVMSGAAMRLLSLQSENAAMLARAEKAEAELAEAKRQEPVAFWWIGPDGKDNGGPYAGKPSDAAIERARNSGCDPQLLYAGPVPAAPAMAVPAESQLQKAANFQYDRDTLKSMYQAWEMLPCCNLMAAIGGAIQDIQAMREGAAVPAVLEEWRAAAQT